MLNVIFKLIVLQPKLVLTHVKNYADLFLEEFQIAIAAWKLLLLLYVLSTVCFGLGLLTAAGAVLLWGALPVLNSQNAWVLLLLPSVLLVTAFLFYLAAKSYRSTPRFVGIQEQLKLDMLAICQSQQK